MAVNFSWSTFLMHPVNFGMLCHNFHSFESSLWFSLWFILQAHLLFKSVLLSISTNCEFFNSVTSCFILLYSEKILYNLNILKFIETCFVAWHMGLLFECFLCTLDKYAFCCSVKCFIHILLIFIIYMFHISQLAYPLEFIYNPLN